MRYLRLSALFVLFLFVTAARLNVVHAEPMKLPAVPRKPSEDGGRLDDILHQLAAEDMHGSLDDGKSVNELIDIVKTRELVMTCNYVSTYALAILTAAGYEARKVQTLTLEAWNCCNNGHTLLEVWHPSYNQWVMVDLDFNRMYIESLTQFVQGRTTPIILANDPLLDPDEFPGESDPDPEEPDIYPRNIQAVGINVNGTVVFDCSTQLSRRVLYYSPRFACAGDGQFNASFSGAPTMSVGQMAGRPDPGMPIIDF